MPPLFHQSRAAGFWQLNTVCSTSSVCLIVSQIISFCGTQAQNKFPFIRVMWRFFNHPISMSCCSAKRICRYLVVIVGAARRNHQALPADVEAPIGWTVESLALLARDHFVSWALPSVTLRRFFRFCFLRLFSLRRAGCFCPQRHSVLVAQHND